MWWKHMNTPPPLLSVSEPLELMRKSANHPKWRKLCDFVSPSGLRGNLGDFPKLKFHTCLIQTSSPSFRAEVPRIRIHRERGTRPRSERGPLSQQMDMKEPPQLCVCARVCSVRVCVDSLKVKWRSIWLLGEKNRDLEVTLFNLNSSKCLSHGSSGCERASKRQRADSREEKSSREEKRRSENTTEV